MCCFYLILNLFKLSDTHIYLVKMKTLYMRKIASISSKFQSSPQSIYCYQFGIYTFRSLSRDLNTFIKIAIRQIGFLHFTGKLNNMIYVNLQFFPFNLYWSYWYSVVWNISHLCTGVQWSKISKCKSLATSMLVVI